MLIFLMFSFTGSIQTWQLRYFTHDVKCIIKAPHRPTWPCPDWRTLEERWAHPGVRMGGSLIQNEQQPDRRARGAGAWIQPCAGDMMGQTLDGVWPPEYWKLCAWCDMDNLRGRKNSSHLPPCNLRLGSYNFGSQANFLDNPSFCWNIQVFKGSLQHKQLPVTC